MDPGLGSNHNVTSTLERTFGTARVNFRYPKALKLSAKSMTDNKWKQHIISTSGLLPWLLPRVQDQYPLQPSSILRHYANRLLSTSIRHLSHIFDPIVSLFCNDKLYVKEPTSYLSLSKSTYYIYFNFWRIIIWITNFDFFYKLKIHIFHLMHNLIS